MGKSQSNKSNDTGKIVSAALIGVVVGGALGILFAPAKGSETRKSLLAKGDQLKDSIIEKFSGLMDSQKDSTDDKEKEGSSHNGSAKA